MGWCCFGGRNKRDDKESKSSGRLKGLDKTFTGSNAQQCHTSKASSDRVRGVGDAKDGNMVIWTAAPAATANTASVYGTGGEGGGCGCCGCGGGSGCGGGGCGGGGCGGGGCGGGG